MGEVLERRLKMRSIKNPVVEGMLNLLVTGAFLNQQYDALFGQFGLTTSAYNVLRILRGSPGGLARGEIGTRMVNPSPDVTRLIDGLSRRGLVRRTRTRGDRRLSLAQITPKGIALMDRVEVDNAQYRARLASQLSETEWRRLSYLCERIYGDKV
jgi:DNA-binding MarR family transcriptional regulator